MKRFGLFIILFFSVSFLSFGQKGQKKLEKSMKAINKEEYSDALKLYDEALALEPNLPLTALQIEGLTKASNVLGATDKMANLYQRAMLLYPENISYIYEYANTKLLGGELEDARTWLKKYTALRNDDPKANKALDMIAVLENIKPMLPNTTVNQSILSTNDVDEFGASFHMNYLVFCSDRDGVNHKGVEFSGRQTLDLYKSVIGSDGRTGSLASFDSDINSAVKHEGPATFTADGKKMFFTQNSEIPDESEKIHLNLYESTYEDGKWVDKKAFKYNTTKSSTMHPALSYDGKTLYFASDRFGGFGGFDIWMCQFEFGRWSEPINLGGLINTTGNEVFPTTGKNGELFYSSKGGTLPSYGGFDIYMATPFADKKSLGFEKLYNMGTPINSGKDDTGLAISPDGSFAIFSSARAIQPTKNDNLFFIKMSSFSEEALLAPIQIGEPLRLGKRVVSSNITNNPTSTNPSVSTEVALAKPITPAKPVAPTAKPLPSKPAVTLSKPSVTTPTVSKPSVTTPTVSKPSATTPTPSTIVANADLTSGLKANEYLIQLYKKGTKEVVRGATITIKSVDNAFNKMAMADGLGSVILILEANKSYEVIVRAAGFKPAKNPYITDKKMFTVELEPQQ
jgi:tetratricopeptide (TPR) repeat protein